MSLTFRSGARIVAQEVRDLDSLSRPGQAPPRTGVGGAPVHDKGDTPAGGATGVRGRSIRIGAGGLGLIHAAAFAVTVVALTPLLFVFWATVETGWSDIVALVFRPRVGELLVNTVLLVAISAPLCTALAIGMAWLTVRTDMPGAYLFSWLNIAPLAIPAFVHGYAWVSIVPSMNGLGSATLLSVLAYYPFLYMPIAATLSRLDPALEDSASSLGHKPSAVFWTVVLPQLKLAILGGGLLFSLHVLAEYGLYAMLRLDTFTTAIVDQYQSTYNGPAANMLAAVLLLLALGLLVPEALIRGRERYARLGPGSARPPRRHRLGAARLPCLALAVLTCCLAIGVPMVTILRWLMISSNGAAQFQAFASAFWTTALLAAIGSIITAIAATPIAWLAVRSPGSVGRILETANYLVGSLPGIVVSLALVFITVRVAFPLYHTSVTLLLAYLIIFLPRALVSLRASIAQVPKELEEAAQSLGYSPARAIVAVTLRIALPGALTAMALVGLGITNELTATLLLAPDDTHTLATQFWAYSYELDYAAAAPYALIMVVLSIPMTVILHGRSRSGGASFPS